MGLDRHNEIRFIRQGWKLLAMTLQRVLVFCKLDMIYVTI
jgi:hypothetical protein